jgi:small subunit ribosomal protein S17
MSENTQTGEAQRGRPKSRIGTVLSNKMTKTVVVQVERRAKHGQYGKYMTEKTRPMSKEKRWRVAEVLVKAEAETQGKAEV